jgi:hypothetical protein
MLLLFREQNEKPLKFKRDVLPCSQERTFIYRQYVKNRGIENINDRENKYSWLLQE